MSLSRQTLLELMSLADGELDGPDKERLERLVATDEEARALVARLRGPEVGAWLAESMDRRAIASGADGIADAVMTAIAADPRISVRPNGATRDGAAAVLPLRGRRSPRFQVIAGAVTAALAVAAAVAIYARTGTEHLDDRAPVASVRVPPVDVEVPSSAMAQQGGGGVEVNEIDAPQRGVSVFEIPVGAAAIATSGPSSVVVWVDDDSGAK
jgi:anti-sigma factor RsiW